MAQNRIIGRVLSVDNFRVFIKIEEEIKGAYKSGINDIYEVARINSYLIIPIGPDRIVALITRVTMKEEVELNSNPTSIMLPTSARYISATMLGTITKKDGKDLFIQGVYCFPSLDNPVWYVTEEDLDLIFDNKKSEQINPSEDYYLPIGISPAFQNYQVKICPDQFFVKHAAILGNTGSGKSCTLTSILRNLFRYKINGNYLTDAHIIIFDTNGEYKDAFIPNDKEPNEELSRINAYYYGGEENVKVPYWLMNWKEFKSLLNPAEGVQAPILNRAIGLAKNETEVSEQTKDAVPDIYLTYLQGIVDLFKSEVSEYWKIKNFSEGISELKSKGYKFADGTTLSSVLDKIQISDSYNLPLPTKIKDVVDQLSQFIEECNEKDLAVQLSSEQNIDMPIYFSYEKLCNKYLDAAIQQESVSNNKIAEFMSTLRLRMNSFLHDKRMSVPLMLKDEKSISHEVLPRFLSFILGDFNHLFQEESPKTVDFISQYNDSIINKNQNVNQVTIIDVSQLPIEILGTITGILGRIILEFLANFCPQRRGEYPIVIVLEEAQNYISEEKYSIAKVVFERIAREGRKYGISLIVSSQRPSELSKTVLSQCNSFIIHRLQNPEDQKYVRGLISSANEDFLDQLPVIPQQHAIVTGDCVRIPVQVRIDDVKPTPNSHNPKFVEKWLNPITKEERRKIYDEACHNWTGKDEVKDDEDTN